LLDPDLELKTARYLKNDETKEPNLANTVQEEKVGKMRTTKNDNRYFHIQYKLNKHRRFLAKKLISAPDPGSGAFLTPGSGKNSGSGSGMNNPDHISESLETFF
jgi:hypothetical protein